MKSNSLLLPLFVLSFALGCSQTKEVSADHPKTSENGMVPPGGVPSAPGAKLVKLPSDEQVDCPSIYYPPQARLLFERDLVVSGTYALDIEADGKKESCEIALGKVEGSKKLCTPGAKDCVVSS